MIGLSIGAVIDGYFKHSIYATTIRRGGLFSLKGMWTKINENPNLPFIVTSVSISFSQVNAKSQANVYNDFIGTDLRVGLTLGYTIKKIIQIYFSPKIFGGPIFYKSKKTTLQGQDQYFFQAGLGSALLLPKGFNLFVNGSVAGEQALSAGLAKSF